MADSIRTDDLLDTSVENEIKDMIKDLEQLKLNQIIGKHSFVAPIYSTSNAYDFTTLMNVDHKNVIATFTPSVASYSEGAIYDLYMVNTDPLLPYAIMIYIEYGGFKTTADGRQRFIMQIINQSYSDPTYPDTPYTPLIKMYWVGGAPGTWDFQVV